MAKTTNLNVRLEPELCKNIFIDNEEDLVKALFKNSPDRKRAEMIEGSE